MRHSSHKFPNREARSERRRGVGSETVHSWRGLRHQLERLFLYILESALRIGVSISVPSSGQLADPMLMPNCFDKSVCYRCSQAACYQYSLIIEN